MKRNWPVAAHIRFIKGDHGFYNGAKSKKIQIDFWDQKIYQYCSRVYQKMRNTNIWGVCFLRKVHFFYIFMRKS